MFTHTHTLTLPAFTRKISAFCDLTPCSPMKDKPTFLTTMLHSFLLLKNNPDNLQVHACFLLVLIFNPENGDAYVPLKRRLSFNALYSLRR
jgi:hypothetical protein